MTQPNDNSDPANAQDQQLISAGAHIGGLLTSVIVPAVIWVIYRERSAAIEEHSRKALNFQLLLLPVYIVASIIVIILPIGFLGSLVQLAVFVFSAIFAIQAAIAAYHSRSSSYPITIDIVKKH